MLDKNIAKLVQKHYNDDLELLALKYAGKDVAIHNVINQIRARRKGKSKFPEWTQNKEVIFPPSISIEQSSSQWTAEYKARLVPPGFLLDMTGGMGIDAYYISKNVDHYILCEINQTLCDINKHNFSILGAENIEVLCTNSADYLTSTNYHFDMIFLDPARRREDNQSRAYFLKQFTPNLLEIQDLLLAKADKVLIKLAPMLDITAIIRDLKNVTSIHVVSVKNEVKEILIECGSTTDLLHIHAVDIDSQSVEESIFTGVFGRKPMIESIEHQLYIYEPFRCILKAQLQDQVAEKFELFRIHMNTQFFTSSELNLDFPGRVFRKNKELPSSKKAFHKLTTHNRYNVISRNYPSSAAELTKKYKLVNGGEEYILAFTDYSGAHRLIEVDRLK